MNEHMLLEGSRNLGRCSAAIFAAVVASQHYYLVIGGRAVSTTRSRAESVARRQSSS